MRVRTMGGAAGLVAVAGLVLVSESTLADQRGLPSRWLLAGEEAKHFEAGGDERVQLDGKPTARLGTTDANAKFASLTQWLDAAEYRGKRVRFSALAKTERVKGWTGIWLQVDPEQGDSPLSYENTQDRPLRGDRSWTPLSIVADVSKDARNIALGLGQDGPGTSWFGRVSLEVVDRDVPLTRRAREGLVNGDFEARELSGWFMSGPGRKDYAAMLVTDIRHGGHQALRLTASSRPDRKEYASAMQFFDAAPYVGKRVRVSIWMKSEGVTSRGDFWVRCQAADSAGDGFGIAGGYSRLDPNTDWQQYVTVFDIPSRAAQIDLGVGIAGPGTIWADDAVFEVVPDDTPLRSGAPTRPRNLDFTQTDVERNRR